MDWLIRAILTLTFIATAALGAYVIAKDPKNKANRLHGLFVLAALGWMSIGLIHAWDPDHHIHTPHLGSGLGGFFATFIIPIIAHFSLHFPRPLRPIRRWHLGLIYLPSTFFAISWLAGWEVTYHLLEGGGYEEIQTPLFTFFLIWIVLNIPAVVAILIWKHKHLTSKLERQQVKYILVGFACTAILCVLFAVVLPYLLIHDATFISPVFFLIWVGFSAYAIARFRLFESAVARVRMIPVINKVRMSAAFIISTITFCIEFPVIFYLVQSGTPGLWWKILLVVMCGRALQGILMSLVLRGIIAAPLQRLTASSERISEGNLDERVNIHPHAPPHRALRRNDEMDVLAETFNRMAGTLEQNIKDLQGLNKELFKEKQLKENVIHSITLGMVVLDLDNRVLECNRTYAEWTGIGQEEAQGRNLFELEPDLSDTEVREMVENLARTGDPVVSQRFSYKPPEKSEACISNVNAFPLKAIDGKVYGIVIIIEDVTERVKLEQQLAQSDKLVSVGQLAAGIAHEVNNPLGSISSLAQMLLDTNEDEEARETLQTIVGQVNRISGILGDLVNFSRPRPAEKGSMHVAAVVDTVSRLASFNKKFRNIEIVQKIDPSVLQITADGNQIQQLILNLILNAADAMPEGGEITISTESIQESQDGAGLRIKVADTGHGISEESRGRIFDPFFTTKPAGHGTGLGLSVCYGIVR